jgi:16S rRNA (guanine966-N2)-methyltransferase
MTATRRPSAGKAGDRRGPAAARNRVRIIGGDWRSRILRFPDSQALRPTPDRVRETVFNWLGQRLDGLACLDLFAGSGAFGFEALSRGASRVVMVERDRVVAAALHENARLLGAEGLEIVQADAMAWLKRAQGPFDVAFVDPPYASGLVPAALGALRPHVAPAARVYVETAEPLPPPPGWSRLREDHAGAVRYALFEPLP